MNTRDHAVMSSWINFAAGLWLMFSPVVLDYTSQAGKINDIFVGLIVTLLSLISALVPFRALRTGIISIFIGIWLLFAPFVLNYTDGRGNDILLGIIFVITGFWNSVATSPYRRKNYR